MVVIVPGEFQMGASDCELCRYDYLDEEPRHLVTVSYRFAVGAYEVTFNEWDACVADGGCGGYVPDDSGRGRGTLPVINVSWHDAQAYVRWLSQKTGRPYRLLSESEWEYVARAGTTTLWFTGNRQRDLCRVGNISDWTNVRNSVLAEPESAWAPCDDGFNHTAPVGSFLPNSFGLYDTVGNVGEWVQDCRTDNYEGAPANGEAMLAGNCEWGVLRGGSWLIAAGCCSRSAFRGGQPRSWRYFDTGFRVALTLPD